MNDIELSDLELFSLIKCQNEEAFNFLFFRYQKLLPIIVNNLYKKFKYAHVEKEELESLGMISTNDSINNYDPNKGNFFNFWYNNCYFYLLNYCQKQLSKQNQITNTMADFSIEKEEMIENVFMTDNVDIPNEISNHELYLRICDIRSKVLNERDNKILDMLVEGYSFKEIASQLNVTYKVIDNRIYLIRKKIKEHL